VEGAGRQLRPRERQRHGDAEHLKHRQHLVEPHRGLARLELVEEGEADPSVQAELLLRQPEELAVQIPCDGMEFKGLTSFIA
jgi:hypothetical protein